MRIGIVGAGISGLTAAWYLSRRHEVVVFEAGTRAGGHTDTHALTDSDGHTVHVDSGFIVFNRPNYPGFCALLDELGIGSRASDMGFSVSNQRSGIEYGTSTLRELLADPRNLARPRFLAMLRDLRRFYREAHELLDADPGLAIGDWLSSRNYSQAFAEEHLLPMVSALWSSGEDAARRFPARFLAEFMANHRMLQVNGRHGWRTVPGGSQRYVEALTSRWNATLRLQCPVRSVRREAGGVRVIHPWAEERFDAVVMACHSDQALSALDDADERERSVLGAIAYQANHMQLHTDISVLPKRRRAWSSWNARVPRDAGNHCSVAYWMNRLQGLDSADDWIVSLNQQHLVDPSRVHAERHYAHPVFRAETLAAQRDWDQVSGRRRVHFCGAYWGWGFHEDGVQSALRVVEAINEERCRVAA